LVIIASFDPLSARFEETFVVIASVFDRAAASLTAIKREHPG
jgi:predicted HicB family RNase H-like nuclease